MEAISLLVEFDKELDRYIMGCRERYGWQFPEIGKIVTNTFGIYEDCETYFHESKSCPNKCI